MSIQRVPLRDIVANRYRRIESYHLSEPKIEALIQSYANSGFWEGSIQARPHPTRANKFEIAFGHHRIEAAKRAKLGEVGLVVEHRSNADMLRMMADENREEFKGDHLVAIETVAVTIEAAARAEIELEPVDPKAPRAFVYDLPGGRTYTLGTVARFLGWTKRDGDRVQPTAACRLAFEAYHEKANIVPALQQLPEEERTRQATSVVLRAAHTARATARRAGKPNAEQEAAAKRAATEAAKQIRDGDFVFQAGEHASKIGRAAARVKPSPVEISTFVRRRAEGLSVRVINLEQEVAGLLNEIWPYREQIDDAAQRFLLRVLNQGDERLRGLFRRWIDRFTTRPMRDVTPQRPKRLSEQVSTPVNGE